MGRCTKHHNLEKKIIKNYRLLILKYSLIIFFKKDVGYFVHFILLCCVCFCELSYISTSILLQDLKELKAQFSLVHVDVFLSLAAVFNLSEKQALIHNVLHLLLDSMHLKIGIHKKEKLISQPRCVRFRRQQCGSISLQFHYTLLTIASTPFFQAHIFLFTWICNWPKTDKGQ